MPQVALQAPSVLMPGDVLELSIVLTNMGDEPFYIVRPDDLGPDGITIVARRGDCQYEASRAHFDRPMETLRFRYVPLFPGDELRLPLPALNDLGSGLSISLPFPGTYRLTASLRSRGSDHEGLIWPIWRGQVVSLPVELEVGVLNEEQREDWVGRLANCAGDDSCDVLVAVEPFQITYLPGAAAPLRELLQRDPEANAIAASALALQGDESDVHFLRALAQDRVDDTRIQDYFRDVAKTILGRDDDPCWRPIGESAGARE